MPLLTAGANRRPLPQRWRGTAVALAAAGLALLGMALSFVQGEGVLRQRRLDEQARARALGRLAYERLARNVGPMLERLYTSGVDSATHDQRGTLPEDGDLMEWGLLWTSEGFLVSTQEAAPPPHILQACGQAVKAWIESSRSMAESEPLVFLKVPDAGGFLALAAPPSTSTDPRIPVAFVNGPAFQATAWGAETATDAQLRVVGDASEAPWSAAMPGSLSFWQVAPTPAAIASESQTRWRQALLLGPVSLVSIIALVALIWRLLRVLQQEEALARLQSDFVAGVSHELKTPLSLIRLFGETLLEDRVPTEDKKREYYDIIVRESMRLTHLINNLLDFSKIESAGRPFEMSVQDVGDAVRSIYEAYRYELDHAQMKHSLVIADNLPPAAIDRDAIGQAVLNLMSNAVKYADDEREMTVEVTPDTRRGRHGVLISLHDRGIGIAPEDRARVFDGFFRAPDPRVRKKRGTGLGLALVRHIVESHGGSVSVESRLIKGTTFRIFLPAAPLHPPAAGRT